jgi:quaternary ammonium compound-resistance protein SugE
MAWILLVLAGLLEIVWAVGLKYTEGFTKPLPTVITVVAMAASVFLLGIAARDLPIGTAYAVWVGIGAVGTAIFGIVLLSDPTNAARLACLALLLASIVGLKLTTPA